MKLSYIVAPYICVLFFCATISAQTTEQYAQGLFKALTAYEENGNINALYDAINPVVDALENDPALFIRLSTIQQSGKTLFERALDIDLRCANYSKSNIEYAITPMAHVVSPPDNAGKIFEDVDARFAACSIESEGIKTQALSTFRKALFGITGLEAFLNRATDTDDESSDDDNESYEKFLNFFFEHATKNIKYLAFDDISSLGDDHLISLNLLDAGKNFFILFYVDRLGQSLVTLR